MSYRPTEYEDHSMKGYLKRQDKSFLTGMLGHLLQLEQKRELSPYEKNQKELLLEIFEELGESPDIDLHTVYYPLISDRT